MKTAISVPDDTFRRVEAQAALLKMNRSEFYSVAAERYLNELAGNSLTAEINAALERGGQSDESNQVARAGLAQLRDLTADDEW